MKSHLNIKHTPILESLPPDTRSHNEEQIAQETRKYWEMSNHCSFLMFPAAYPEIQFNSESGSLLYQQYVTNREPGWELVKSMRQAHYKVLKGLNHSKLQVRNFILPVRLIKLKYIDPYSRQQIIEQICSYLRTQIHLRNVVLEQAEVTLPDLCRLLLSISSNAQVKRLFLWQALNQCQSPFKGPLQSKINLDNLPRIPFTYNPGGRKFLKHLKQMNMQEELESKIETEIGGLRMSSATTRFDSLFIDDDVKCSDTTMEEMYKQLFEVISNQTEREDHVCTQVEVGVQCNMSHEAVNSIKIEEVLRLGSLAPENKSFAKSNISVLVTKAKAEVCLKYLKLHQNNPIPIDVLKKIYKIALNGLTHLTTLSVNYCLLADGTGSALLSIGSLSKGTLRNLEILCVIEELPSGAHKQYDTDANHAIPDMVWRNVKEKCPDLKVHIVLVSLLPYNITKMFVTKSIPLHTFNIDSAYCTTLIRPQLEFFSTLRFLRLNFNQTLQSVNILIWHSSGRIDSSLEIFIKETQLHSFVYYGPLQHKATVSKLCDAALLPTSKLFKFKLMVRGDPCYPHIADELTAQLYQKYKPEFCNRNIEFVLGTCVSDK